MKYCVVIIVDNSAEDPSDGRAGLRDELLPVLQAMPGFVEARLLTNYDRGRGVALVTFHTSEQAEALANSVQVGQEIRNGVSVLSSEVLELTAEG